MRVFENREYNFRSRFVARARRVAGSTIAYLARMFVLAWQQAFPMHSPDDPNAPPHIAKAQALREGAVLSEDVRAIAGKRVP